MKTFATIDTECLSLSKEGVIDRIFSAATDDDLPMYFETVEQMYQFEPHEEELRREFEAIRIAFGIPAK